MKKVFTIVLLAFLGIAQAQKFTPGVRAGINLSKFTKGHYEWFNEEESFENDRDYSSKVDFYIGLTGAIKLTRYYTLQPELSYSREGTILNIDGDVVDRRLNVSFISPTINNKFTLTDKFNIHVGAAINLQVDANFKTDSDADFTLFLGTGYNFNKNWGIELRARKGFIPILDYSNGNHTNVVFSMGATYMFDLK